MNRNTALLFAGTLGLVGLGAIIIRSMGAGAPPMAQAGPTDTPEPSPPGYVVITPPAGMPTPYEFTTGSEAIEHVRAVLGVTQTWTASYAALTTVKDFEEMRSGGYIEPRSTEEAQEIAQPVWVVAFEAAEPFAFGMLLKGEGMYRQDGGVDTMGTQAVVVLTDWGNVYEVSMVSEVNDLGTVTVPFRAYELEDVAALPPPP